VHNLIDVNVALFPFADYWWLYLAFTGLVAILLAIDLAFHRQDRPISFRNAAIWTAVWISLALAFGYVLYLFAAARHSPAVGRQLSLEFLAGYVVEESLSVDNMFVFALVFRYFAVPLRYQHKVLFYGVLGAMIFRGLFIAAGSALVRFEWIMILFGLFLILTGIRMAVQKEQQLNPDDSLVIRWVRRFLPVTGELHGSRFLVTVNGIRHITPLMVVLLFLETTDLLFAVDSVPAVFGVTREPFVVYTSNVFAVLGLRAMFFLLAGAMDRFHVLKHGLALVLVFVGLKMVWLDHLYGGRFPIGVSLGIISAVIAVSIFLSLAFPKAVAPARARPAVHAGRIAQSAAGAIFLMLSLLGFLYAAGPGHSLLPLPALDDLGAHTLYWAAACNLLCAVLLLGGAWVRKRV
jgi:tellurite resistance protein TerC